MKNFLRYNSRHHLYFDRIHWLPELNPISSRYSSKGEFMVYEPLWLFRLRQRIFAHAGKQRCGDRGQGSEMPDTWDWGPDDNRTCSYCGSIHPEDFVKVARRALGDERYEIEGTMKSYKYYIRQPGVRNASEGAIKFYTMHGNFSEKELLIINGALKVSSERFEQRMKRI